MSKELLRRLRSPATVFYEYTADDGALLREAADRIEALEAVAEALEELVTLKLAKDIGFAYSPGDGLDIDAPEYHRRKGPAWAAARAALAKARDREVGNA